jgi:hypothetical protein
MIFSIDFGQFFVNFRAKFCPSILDPFLVKFRWGVPGGQKSSKFGVPKCHFYRFLLYSSVYDFRSERSAPGPPIFDRFLTKVQPICGEWHFYRGRFWGSESGKFLQKVTKFQKIYKIAPPGPPDPKKSIFDILDPPMANQF